MTALARADGSDRELGEIALRVAIEAAELVRQAYDEAPDIQYKGEGDSDPVTQADRRANDHIVRRLSDLVPEVPIVSEESPPPPRSVLERADGIWFVDPLDGTRDFIKKNGQFAVMIGFADAAGARLGAIVCPATNRRVLGIRGAGAAEGDDPFTGRELRVTQIARLADARVASSRSRRQPWLDELEAGGRLRERVRVGSAGVKALMVASGECDAYVHIGRAGARWDVCAPIAIVEGAGGRMTEANGDAFLLDGRELENSRGLVAASPALHRAIVRAHRARSEER